MIDSALAGASFHTEVHSTTQTENGSFPLASAASRCRCVRTTCGGRGFAAYRGGLRQGQ